MSFIRDLFTTADNAHYELSRVGLALGLLAVIGYQGYALFKGQPFNPSEFGIAIATVLGAGGLGISLKDRARTNDVANGGPSVA